MKNSPWREALFKILKKIRRKYSNSNTICCKEASIVQRKFHMHFTFMNYDKENTAEHLNAVHISVF